MKKQRIFLGLIGICAVIFSACCITFGTLTVGTRYNLGSTFSAGTLTFNTVQFFWTNGNPSPNGFVEIYDRQRAGGNQEEIWFNNLNLEFVLPDTVKKITFKAGHWGGNMNLSINGNLQNFTDVASINGTIIDGVSVSTTGSHNIPGEWSFSGVIYSFYVGGQEFAIDDVCITTN